MRIIQRRVLSLKGLAAGYKGPSGGPPRQKEFVFKFYEQHKQQRKSPVANE